jgi:hypothetical protein
MENDLKSQSRGFSADMTPEAIAKRLDIAADLHETAAWLQRFLPIPHGAPPPDRSEADDADQFDGIEDPARAANDSFRRLGGKGPIRQ